MRCELGSEFIVGGNNLTIRGNCRYLTETSLRWNALLNFTPKYGHRVKGIDENRPQSHWAHQLLKLLPERVITNRRITTWQDAQHQYMAIAQRAVERPALYAVAVIAAIATMNHSRTRLTLRHGAVQEVAPAAAQSRAGREQVRPWCTRLPR
jgi:hypothetical protein